MPPLTPVTVPLVPTVAIAVLALLHTPPGVASDNAIVDDAQTVDGPVIVPALRKAPIVITLVATAVPQLLVTVYLMVSIPGVIAVTTPLLLIVAIVVLLRLHTPPVALSV